MSVKTGIPTELGTEKISKLLRQYAVPAIIAMTASSLYNMVDSIFIGHGVGTFAIAGLALTFPLMNYITVPMLKKQLHARQAEIDRTHIVVTFNEEEVIYENLTVKVEASAPVVEQTPETEENTEEKVEVVEEAKEVEKPSEERVFKLSYQNFLSIKETTNLFLFYLDRQTVIILPKETYTTVGELAEFKNFILNKVNPRRVKFLKK